jgi:hypothetical protein
MQGFTRSGTWTVRDEDAYTGPWNRRTSAPVLFVASEWDPATNYDDAVSAQKRLPNSRLFTNDNWGHTSYRARSERTPLLRGHCVGTATVGAADQPGP